MENLSAHIANTGLKDSAKILVITSSPRENGNTAKLLNAFVSQLPKSAWIKTFSAYELNAKPCTDCGYCKQHRACIFDDLNEFLGEFENTDLIIIATPVYNFSFPSPLKAIIDRFQVYYNARFERNERPPIKKRRKAVIVATCGSDDEYGFDVIEYQLKRAFTVLNVELVGMVTAKGMDTQGINDSDILKAKELADSITI